MQPLINSPYSPFNQKLTDRFIINLLEDFFVTNNIDVEVDRTGLLNLGDTNKKPIVQAMFIHESLANKDWSMDCGFPLTNKHYRINIYMHAPGNAEREQLKDIMTSLMAFTVHKGDKIYSAEVSDSLTLSTAPFQNRVLNTYMTPTIQEGEKSNKILGIVEILFNIHI
jgi:hypothetical protein